MRSEHTNDAGLFFLTPPGFTSVNLAAVEALDTIRPDLEEVLSEIDPAVLSQALGLMGVLARIAPTANIWYFALGAHPDEEGGVTTSALVLSVQEVPENFELRAAVPVMTGSWPAGVTPEAFIVELPAGPAAVTHAISTLDSLIPSGSSGAREVWQGRIAVPFPAGGQIAVLDLSTPAVEHAADYLDVLCAMAYTIEFGANGKPRGQQPPVDVDRIREVLG